MPPRRGRVRDQGCGGRWPSLLGHPAHGSYTPPDQAKSRPENAGPRVPNLGVLPLAWLSEPYRTISRRVIMGDIIGFVIGVLVATIFVWWATGQWWGKEK